MGVLRPQEWLAYPLQLDAKRDQRGKPFPGLTGQALGGMVLHFLKPHLLIADELG